MKKADKKYNKFTGSTFAIFGVTKRFNKRTINLEVVELADGTKESVMIMAVNKRGRVLLLEKYCAAHNKKELVLPGGKRDGNESLEKTANRELVEETGWCGKNLKPLGPLHILPAYLVGTTYGFFTQDIVPATKEGGDEVEYMKTKFYDYKCVLELIKEGKIRDVRTMAIILYVNNFIFSRQ